MPPQNFTYHQRHQAPPNNFRNMQNYKPFGQPPTKPQFPRPEPMDVDRSLHSRAVNYMNRPQINNTVKRPSNFSQQIPLKQQRNFHIESATQQDTQQDQHYQYEWTPTPLEYENTLTTDEIEQPDQTYVEENSMPETQDYIDINFLE